MLDVVKTLPAPLPDRYIAQPVHSPEFWRDWVPNMNAVGALTPDALLADAGRLLVAAPHPDDEVLMCAGLMQAALAQGMDAVIVAVTDGEACFGSEGHRAAVAELRSAERRAGLQALGAGGAPIHRLSIPDGEVSAHLPRLRCALDGLLQSGDLVVAPWRLDGHPDHDATGSVAAAACVGRPWRLLEAPVWMWHWSTPSHRAVEWTRLRVVSIPTPAVEQKMRALRCHASQLAPGAGHTAVVDDALYERAQWPFESFFVS